VWRGYLAILLSQHRQAERLHERDRREQDRRNREALRRMPVALQRRALVMMARADVDLLVRLGLDVPGIDRLQLAKGRAPAEETPEPGPVRRAAAV
jgi:hypothetical protein